MRRAFETNLLAVAMMTMALPLLAQDSIPATSAGSYKVFILNFGDARADQPSDAKDLNEFIPSLLQWRLRAESRIAVSRLPSISCSSDTVGRNIRALAASNEAYYTVQGSVTPRIATTDLSNPEVGVAPSEMVLSYELDKVTNCVPETLLRRTVPVTADNALDAAGVMADLIALKLDKVLAQSPGTVTKPSDIAGSDQDLNAQVDVLLCRTPGTAQASTQSCTEQATAAIPLLRELNKRHPKDASNLDWLGRAQADAGLPLDASKSFDAALNFFANAPPQQRWPVLERSADTLYRLDSYSVAAEQYQAALDTIAKVPETEAGANAARMRLKLARVLRFDGDREGAFDILVKGMPTGDDAKPYVLELRDLVSSLQPKELTWADQRLDAPDAAALDPNVKALVYNREAERDLNGTGEKVKIDAELKKAEALAGSIETAIQVATLWWRSQWYAAQGMMAQAGKSIDESLKLNNDSDPNVRYQAAVFYYVQASQLGENDPKVLLFWQHAATIAEPLLTENKRTTPLEILRYADSIYRNANHNINQDETTRSVYEAIIRQYPSDFAVRRGLLGLYTDFLKDPTRALESARATYVLPETQHDPATLLDIVEVYVLNGKYDDANNVLESLASTLADASLLKDLGYSAVSYFYQTWVALAKHDTAGATRAQNGWLLAMARYRNNDPQDFVWRFDGALDTLNKLQGLQNADKRTLRQMILAMTDVAVPLPHPSQ